MCERESVCVLRPLLVEYRYLVHLPQRLGLRVGGVGFRAQVPGFRIQGSGLRFKGLDFRVQGLGFRV